MIYIKDLAFGITEGGLLLGSGIEERWYARLKKTGR